MARGNRAAQEASEPKQLSRRERQILDILFELHEASVEDVRSRLPDPPSYSAARAMLVRLENKGLVTHAAKDLKYVYSTTARREEAGRNAVARLVRTFFDGSVSQAIAGMLDVSKDQLDERELERLSDVIARARRDRE